MKEEKMKNNLRLAAVIFTIIFTFFPPCISAEEELPFPNPDVTISMDFKDASLKDILKIFSIQSGLNFIANQSLQNRTVTLYLDKVPIREAIDELFKANNLSYELDKKASIILVKDWGTEPVETITRVFYLKYATVSSSLLMTEKGSGSAAGSSAATSTVTSSIANVITKLISGNGSVIEDARTNSLIITDIPSKMAVIARTITALDVAVPQVMLEVEMLDVSKNAVDKIGLKFDQSPLTLNTSLVLATIGTKFPFGHVNGGKGSVLSGSFNPTSSASAYKIQFDFLKTLTDTKFLARPKLLTLNNETAEISITKDEVVGRQDSTVSGTVTTTSTTWIRSTDLTLTKEGTGIFLRVTPQINLETNEVTMVIKPKSSVTTPSALAGASNQADAEVRSTKSVVKVKDGETVVLGGLIHTEKTVAITKLPILGDIPFLKVLFRNKSQSPGLERELLVFITPHIIRDPGIELTQAKKIIIPEREQGTISGIGRQAAISSSLNTFERKSK
jgi:type IV pilus assembly protein PilQ